MDTTKTLTHAEAPLISLITKDLSKMTPDELLNFQATIRAMRAVPAQRTAAVTTSGKSIKAKASGINIDSLL